MGYEKHHAIIVTAGNEAAKIAHEKAKELFGGLCSDLISAIMNDYVSFFIAPDGSKEGWEESNCYDELREKYIFWLHLNKITDFVEVAFGGDLEERQEQVMHSSKVNFLFP